MSELRPPPTSLLDVYRGGRFKEVYAASVNIRGGEAQHGRASGIIKSDDGALDLELRLPPAMGGPGGGTNPEQLLAAAYGACFHGALKLLATKHKIPIDDLTIDVTVAFGRDPSDGRYSLTSNMTVRLPGIERRLAEQLVRESERNCPYAKLMRRGTEGSIVVEV